LKEFIARMSIKILLTFAVTILLFFVMKLFGKTPFSPFTHHAPRRLSDHHRLRAHETALKILLDTLFPNSRDIFNAIYSMDKKVEEEKTALLEEMAPYSPTKSVPPSRPSKQRLSTYAPILPGRTASPLRRDH
jgi:hypothetical protein